MMINLTCFCLTADRLTILRSSLFCCDALEAAYCTESFDFIRQGFEESTTVKSQI